MPRPKYAGYHLDIRQKHNATTPHALPVQRAKPLFAKQARVGLQIFERNLDPGVAHVPKHRQIIVMTSPKHGLMSS